MTLWNIPAEQPFLDALVAGIFDRVGRDPLALATAQILLPTRRAVRSLREAFLRATGGESLLLPRMAALGDLDADELDLALPAGDGGTLDIPPAITSLRREFLLARQIRRQTGTGAILPGQALALAGTLATLIDQVHTERTSFDRLERLVPADLAHHWAVTVEFLAIVSRHWPDILAEEGALDPADRRNRLIAAQIAAWRRTPPTGLLIAAGLESAIPAVADLLALILDLPTGAIVLNGMDAAADDVIWEAASADPTHPQHGFARLLGRLALDRRTVPAWAPPPPGDLHAAARAGLIRELMRPAAVTEHWRGLKPLDTGATDGMARIDLAGSQEEASTIALLLRDRLETPGATAMLITPDRDLARRVASEMRRWEIEIDDSAGRPLGQTAPGVFLRLLAEAVAERLAPVPLLALLKHPLAACGEEPAAFREQVRWFEREYLRGPRPAPGLAGLRMLAGDDADANRFVDRLADVLGEFLALIDPLLPTSSREGRRSDAAGTPPLAGGGREEGAAVAGLLQAHIIAAERLAATPAEAGAERLWSGEAGEALANFVTEFAAAAADFDPIDGADYPMLFEAGLGGRVVRPVAGRHPRLQILGALEARLQSADLVIIGAVNEGTWPPQPAHDPWMSRPMRNEFGLGSSELAVGVAAHDFTIALSAPEVVLTRAVRVEGTPTVPSRWLLRLDTVLQALRLYTLPLGGRGYHGFRAYQAMLDRPAAFRSIAPPEPRPPLAARPRQLSVTQIELWMRDPYAIYARHILRLKPLDPLDADPGVADRGTFIHQALENFVIGRGTVAQSEWLKLLTRLGHEAFGDAMARPGVATFWWPRFLKIADWVVETEIARLPEIRASRSETRGKLTLPDHWQPFTLSAKADRIDRLASGGIAIIDYKTGTLPTAKELDAGYSPQLALEAVIAEAGGFDGVAGGPVEELAFWRLSGGSTAGEIKRLDDVPTRIANAAEGVQRLIDMFDDPATPYHSQPQAAYAPRYSDYDHLARVREWGNGGAD